MAAISVMIVGPDNVNRATIPSSCLVNGNPWLVTENVACFIIKDSDRLAIGLTTIGGSRDRNAALSLEVI